MELTWYGRTCVRMKGKDAVVVTDPYQSVVGPTGRGITGEIVTFSHGDDSPLPKAKGTLSRDGATYLPSSLEDSFVLDGPGEFEVRHVLITGVRTFRDDGKQRGNVAFVVELDGIHTAHLGDIGHLLTDEELAELGTVDIACVSLGGAMNAHKTLELVAQIEPKIVIPIAATDDLAAYESALGTFFHELGAAAPPVQPRLAIMPSGLPEETTTVLLESRGKD